MPPSFICWVWFITHMPMHTHTCPRTRNHVNTNTQTHPHAQKHIHAQSAHTLTRTHTHSHILGIELGKHQPVREVCGQLCVQVWKVKGVCTRVCACEHTCELTWREQGEFRYFLGGFRRIFTKLLSYFPRGQSFLEAHLQCVPSGPWRNTCWRSLRMHIFNIWQTDKSPPDLTCETALPIKTNVSFHNGFLIELRSGPENQARPDQSPCTLCPSPARPDTLTVIMSLSPISTQHFF